MLNHKIIKLHTIDRIGIAPSLKTFTFISIMGTSKDILATNEQAARAKLEKLVKDISIWNLKK